MKILVFSDSHRSLSGMYAAIDLHRPQQVIHLGDIMDDAEEVAEHYPAGADILLFGHTHSALCQQLEDGLWMMNPGTARSSYGMIEISGGQISCTLHRV